MPVRTARAESHQVAIWDGSGNVLVQGSVGIGTSGSIENEFRYVQVSDTPLSPGQTYTIGATFRAFSPDYLLAPADSISADPAISFAGAATGLGTGLVRPNTFANALDYFGPNFQFTTAPDLAVTQPIWNTAQGGVDFGYTISGADLTQPTTAAYYWSTDTTFDPSQDTLILGSVTTTQTAQTPPGTSVPVHVDAAALATMAPPTGTKYLLAVVDPNNAVAESDEPNGTIGANNVQFAAYDPIKMDSATSPSSKSISFSYDITEAEPGQPITVGIYRSSQSELQPDDRDPRERSDRPGDGFRWRGQRGHRAAHRRHSGSEPPPARPAPRIRFS